jgi:hypothetical protein
VVLRLHPLDDDEWRRLAASRRTHDMGAYPDRAAIGAIEVELRALRAMRRPSATDRPQATPGAA